jgi:opacity protein-like surface antigen
MFAHVMTGTLAMSLRKEGEMRKILIAVIAAGSLLAGAASASAAQPANQACLGHDFSGYAQGGSAFGGFIQTLATNTQGVGGEIQAHLAGLVPDTVIPNSCND